MTTFISLFTSFLLIVNIQIFAQPNSNKVNEHNSKNIHQQIAFSQLSAKNIPGTLEFNNRKGMSLAIDYNRLKSKERLSASLDSIDYSYKPWDNEKHFWVGFGEIAILEFIPWALARWIRH